MRACVFFMSPENRQISEGIQERFFPNGNKDIEEGMYEIGELFERGLDLPICRKIFIQAVGRLGLSGELTYKGLIAHLYETNELDYFPPEQLDLVHKYLGAIYIAEKVGKGAADITKKNGNYYLGDKILQHNQSQFKDRIELGIFMVGMWSIGILAILTFVWLLDIANLDSNSSAAEDRPQKADYTPYGGWNYE